MEAEFSRNRWSALEYYRNAGERDTFFQFASIYYGCTLDYIIFRCTVGLPESRDRGCNRHTEVDLLMRIADLYNLDGVDPFEGREEIVLLWSEYVPCPMCLRYLLGFAVRYPNVQLVVGFRGFLYIGLERFREDVASLEAPPNLRIIHYDVDHATGVVHNPTLYGGPPVPTPPIATTQATHHAPDELK